jgi:uracil-DNA glycosylase
MQPDTASPSRSVFPDNLPSGWREQLRPEAAQPYFHTLCDFLRKEYRAGHRIFPPQGRILRTLQEVDYDRVKVVILGQDPYHGEGQAMGLCFAVPNSLEPKPPSLVNIFQEIETDLGKPVNRAHSELSHWTSQGVLLLNTVLTVRRGQAFSHRGQGWETFTDRVIRLLDARPEPLVFILWGSPAKQKKALITQKRHRILESAHPSPLSAHRGFFGSRPFSRANAILKELGREPIDWQITS